MRASRGRRPVISLVIAERERVPVHTEERDGAGQSEPLIAVYQRVVSGERVHQRRFLRYLGIGVGAEYSGLRPSSRGCQQAMVAYCYVIADSPPRHMNQLGGGQVDHWPSRSRASA
jgi:hypothetical protein